MQQPSGAHQAFGDLLRLYRERAGLSQEALAERAGISSRGLLYLERGLRRPYPATLRRLADALSLAAEEQAALTLAIRPDSSVPVPTAPSVTVPAAAPSPMPSGSRHNLPAALSSFIGREQAQEKVRNLLASHRLVTLVGAGGVGKTRLALALAEQLVATFPDGVWLVELAALADPGLVPSAVAQALAVPEELGRSVTETLCDHCRTRNTLLLLDNCEHLVPTCRALVRQLLQVAPGLRILTTSREALGMAGEYRYRVPSLSVPDPQHLPTPELAGSYEAIRLFVTRAQERQHTFTLTAANARAVAEICARLDGVPLAIELSAARVAVMSVAMIAAHLDDRFRLLTTGSGDLPTRQRTLHATLDWSWDLLGEQERALLSRLSVFAGGWTLEAAAAVCTGEGMDYWAVVDGLDALVNRSLVQMDETPDGAARYHLLETVREYASEQLVLTGEDATTRNSHLSYLHALAEQAVQAYRGAELGTWLDRLEADHDNLRAALNWAVVAARGEEGLQLAAALAPFWEYRGHLAEGRRRLQGLLAVVQGSPAARARALNAAGTMIMREGDGRQALAFYQESLTLRRALLDMRGMAVALTNIGSAHVELGEYAQAEPAYAEALELYRALEDQSGVATAFNNQSVVARELGNLERATTLLAESLALRRAQGDWRGVAEASNNLGLVAAAQGQYAQAGAYFQEGLLLSREVGSRQLSSEALEGLAWANAALGQPRRAARLGGAAAAERETLGMPASVSERRYRDTAVQAMRAALGEDTFAVAWAEGRDMPLGEAIALALEGRIAP